MRIHFFFLSLMYHPNYLPYIAKNSSKYIFVRSFVRRNFSRGYVLCVMSDC